MTHYYLGTALLVVLVAGGAFLAGMKFQQTRQPVLSAMGGVIGQKGQGGQVTFRAGGTSRAMMDKNAGFRPVMGEIINQDETSITVKMADGSTKIVLLSDTTAVSTSTEGSRDDLSVGTQVSVLGTENADGSVTADNVQVNPQAVRVLTQ